MPTVTDILDLRLLPGERILAASRRTILTPLPEIRDGLYLTTDRVIYAGSARVWGIFPNGNALKAAYVEDVDVGGVYRAHAPIRFLVIAAVLVAISVVILRASGDGGSRVSSETDYSPFAALMIVVAGALAIIWLFVRREILAFNVAGERAFEYGYWNIGDGREVTAEFLNRYFELKFGIDSSGWTPIGSSGLEL